MRIAFYAPMKPPDHPTPSGDRQMGRLLIETLEAMGHTVELVSRLRTWQRELNPDRTAKLAAESAGEAEKIVATTQRPDLFVTYHVYHKAPDWIGPAVATALDIPYAIIEASHAEHRREGPWRSGLEASEAAIQAADAVVAMNARDRRGLTGIVAEHRLFDLKPFIDAAPFLSTVHRSADGPVRLLTVAMMRPGDKSVSYRTLADALARLSDLDWTLTIVGDGPARTDLAPLFPTDRTTLLGAVPADALPALYADADVFVWPGFKEAYGLVYLEAMASGLPVIGGRNGGVPDIVLDGKTGILAPPEDSAAQAAAIRQLIEDADLRRRMGPAARTHVAEHHDIKAAKTTLAAILSAASENATERRP